MLENNSTHCAPTSRNCNTFHMFLAHNMEVEAASFFLQIENSFLEFEEIVFDEDLVLQSDQQL